MIPCNACAEITEFIDMVFDWRWTGEELLIKAYREQAFATLQIVWERDKKDEEVIGKWISWDLAQNRLTRPAEMMSLEYTPITNYWKNTTRTLSDMTQVLPKDDQQCIVLLWWKSCVGKGILSTELSLKLAEKERQVEVLSMGDIFRVCAYSIAQDLIKAGKFDLDEGGLDKYLAQENFYETMESVRDKVFFEDGKPRVWWNWGAFGEMKKEFGPFYRWDVMLPHVSKKIQYLVIAIAQKMLNQAIGEWKSVIIEWRNLTLDQVQCPNPELSIVKFDLVGDNPEKYALARFLGTTNDWKKDVGSLKQEFQFLN